MTRFDIKIRRERITEGRMRSHMNFGSLLARHRRHYRRRTRGWLLLLIVTLVALAGLIGWFVLA